MLSPLIHHLATASIVTLLRFGFVQSSQSQQRLPSPPHLHIQAPNNASAIIFNHDNAKEVGKPLEDMLDEFVIAVASDRLITGKARLLDLNDPECIADFIADWLKSAA
nr:hypothetical protein [Serratia sp. OS31]